MRNDRLTLLFCFATVVAGCGGASMASPTSGSGSMPMPGQMAQTASADDAPMPAAPPPDQEYAKMSGDEGPAKAEPRNVALELDSKRGPPKEPSPAPPKPNQPATTPAIAGEGAGQGDGSQGTSDRRSPILIYKADFTMSVYEVQKSIDAVEALAKKSGGYLSLRDDRTITIRVPAGEFQGVVGELSKLGEVVSRNVTAEDVTAEYRDLEVQLQNALALRERFAKLLDKAVKVDEALQIEQQLGRITGEIERIKGRLKLLGELARYSTLTVRFAPRVDQQVQGGPFVLPLPWLTGLGLPRLMQLR